MCIVRLLDYDIIGLVETHLRIGVSGYMWYGNNRIVHMINEQRKVLVV